MTIGIIPEIKTKKMDFYFVLSSFIRNLSLREKILSLEKIQILFGFLLTYSYLCSPFDLN